MIATLFRRGCLAPRQVDEFIINISNLILHGFRTTEVFISYLWCKLNWHFGWWCQMDMVVAKLSLSQFTSYIFPVYFLNKYVLSSEFSECAAIPGIFHFSTNKMQISYKECLSKCTFSKLYHQTIYYIPEFYIFITVYWTNK